MKPLAKHAQKGLSVVVPVLNEAGNVPMLLKRLETSISKAGFTYEIIFIDDHSTDNTAEVIRKYSKKYPIQYFKKNGKKGKAQSLLEGFKHASYELICMIDSDLQYPPEVIPEMLQRLNDGYDIVLTNRTEPHASLLRRVMSKSFNFLFCRLLHNIPHDVQSGLKIFRKEIIERIEIDPFPWSFDLEFLISAKDAGYRMTSIDIVFDPRNSGTSKVNIIWASIQIGLSAILLKIQPDKIIPFHAKKLKKIGQGFHYRQKEFVHYSDLNIKDSAVRVFLGHQIFFICLFILALTIGLLYNWEKTITYFVAGITFVYFADLLFNLFLIYRSLVRSPEIKITEEEMAKVTQWPVYTIFCPLYKEWRVVKQFVEAIEKLDYPKNKLQVQLLLEEDDVETVEYVRSYPLPAYFDVVVVPHSMPKTKPKACNYGLMFARGKYAVIYDAEDMPDTQQLKKAVVAFSKTNPNIACIQAKLNYYNRSQNILTRLFTAEYSLWFDLILTGLQSLNAPIPLGGTSNHFKVEKLREVKGWDSFNVTEDCDLGIRLAKKGYYTAIIDSDTLEEANSDPVNWINQRSRWIKGYMQTYLVHMRDPIEFLRSHNRVHFLTFQAVVGGKILSLFINPFMWVTTILYFSLRSTIGPTVERFFPGPVLYFAVFSLIFGNFLYMYYYMIGCAKRKQYDLIKYVFLIPFYWLGMSIASWKALSQLIFRPHYWQKTQHGLHLKDDVKTAPPLQIQSDIPVQLENSNQSLKIRKLFYSGGVLVLAGIFGNILNYLYNGYLTRSVDIAEFGLVSLIGNFLFLTVIPLESLSSSIVYRSAFYLGKYKKSLTEFWKNTRKTALIGSIIVSILWVLFTPVLAAFFQSENLLPFYIFTPVWIFNTLLAVDMGYLTGNQKFSVIAVIALFTPLIKTLSVFLFVELGRPDLIYISIPFSIVIASILAYIFVRMMPKDTFTENEQQKLLTFPTKYFWSTVLTRFSLVSYLTLDVLLVKHFLSPELAGQYAVIALVGKMIFFIGGLFNQFIIPLISKESGESGNGLPSFRIIFFASTLSSWMAYVVIGIFGEITAPLLLGDSIRPVAHLLPYYGFGVFAFTISSSIISYHLVRKSYLLAFTSFFLSLFQIGALYLFHDNLTEIIEVMTAIGVLNLISILFLHFFNNEVASILRNIIDFIGLLIPLPKKKEPNKNKLRILMLNWRDTRHIWSGGAEEYVHNIAKHLVLKGHQVTLFCGNDTHSPRYEELDGVEIVRRGGFFTVYIWAFLYYILRFRGQYDVIIDSVNGVPFFTPLYSKIPVVGVIHHVHQEVFREHLPPLIAGFACFLEAQMMPMVYKKHTMVTVSESTRENMKYIGFTDKKAIDIVNPGLDPEKYAPQKKTQDPSILYLGRLKKYKTIDVVIESLPEILKQFPKTHFTIAGFGEYKTQLQNTAMKLGVSEFVTFTGRIPEKKKLSLLAESWVLVNPSFMEGWGITAIEASASGTAVVASNVPGLRDSVQHEKTGLLVRYGSVEEFTESILFFLKNKKERLQCEKNSLVWAKRFSWEKSADKMLQVLQSII